ncbi:MAG: hypothetical protein SGI91_04775 [Alphaproteobacteria bacterium]|nr:hypothetical protein [Alphaproteobacteria bacterium]
MFRTAKIVAALIAAFALAACETGAQMYVGADAGFVVASIAKPPGSTYESVALAYRGQDGNSTGTLSAPMPSVAVARLSPGQYEFYSFDVKGPKKDYTPLFVYSIPFTVESGKVTYLGQYLTLDNANEPYFVISNEQARDMASAAKTNADLANLPTVTAVPNPGKVPYFRKAPLPTRKH